MNKNLWNKNFILIAVINFSIFVGYNMIITGIPVFVSSLGASGTIVGLMTSAASIASIFIRPLSGNMVDRFGRKSLLLISLGLISIIIVCYAIIPLLGFILTLRILHGIGWGIGSTTSSTMAADSIPKNNFAEGMGYIAITTALSAAIAPALSISLLRIVGVLPMFLTAAGITFFAFTLAIFTSTKKTTQHTAQKKINLKNLFYRDAILPAFLMFLVNCAFASITTFIVLHCEAKHIEHISSYFIVYAIVSILSRPIIGKLVDKHGVYLPGIFSCLGVVLTLILVSFAVNTLILSIAGVVAGLGLGTAMGTFQTMAVSKVSTENKGSATSTFLIGIDLGNAVGAPIAGLFASSLGYANMYIVMTAFALVATIIIIINGKKKISKYNI